MRVYLHVYACLCTCVCVLAYVHVRVHLSGVCACLYVNACVHQLQSFNLRLSANVCVCLSACMHCKTKNRPHFVSVGYGWCDIYRSGTVRNKKLRGCFTWMF